MPLFHTEGIQQVKASRQCCLLWTTESTELKT